MKKELIRKYKEFLNTLSLHQLTLFEEIEFLYEKLESDIFIKEMERNN